ncbi:hypothetical protein BV22DRAFT_1191860 [Leucogyrophana mollusca]|uniref:Uncharacterized protein n=1 Tax=Leucogyrophana mollusca TaxID=85980 RepID=A0ACB8BXQ0_9AGAM|nr:hypothetical protein BV22DRAFT_1191860 [Leucogyrophana mollusca]
MPSVSSSSLDDAHETHVHVQFPSEPCSVESSLTLTPTILISDHTLSKSSSFSTHSPSIKFAPLPAIEPKKRRLVPLGVSGRSRRRRDHEGSSLWAEPSPEEAVEDPLITFGKFVVSSSRSLWKRVRKKSGRLQEHNEGSPSTEKVVAVENVDGDNGKPERLAKEREERSEQNGNPKVASVPSRRFSWSPSPERGPPDLTDRKRAVRRSTGTLPPIPSFQEIRL